MDELFIRERYGECPKPTFVKEYNTWVLGVCYNDKFWYECGDLEYITSEYTRVTMTYSFRNLGTNMHVHTFEDVLKFALRSEDFLITEEFEYMYSKQQLNLISRIREKRR